jgi:hypothetical protein
VVLALLGLKSKGQRLNAGWCATAQQTRETAIKESEERRLDAGWRRSGAGQEEAGGRTDDGEQSG